jgi:hypothetical protein
MKAVDTKNTTPTAKQNTSFFGPPQLVGAEQEFFTPTRSAENNFFSAGSTYSTVQAKLTVGQPGDKFEKEADTAADKVVQKLATPEAAQAQAPTQTQAPASASTPASASPSAARAATATPQISPLTTNQEEKVQKEESEEEKGVLQREFAGGPPAQPSGEAPTQPSGNASPQPASPGIETSLSASKGSGAPLPDNTRTQMESAFNTDFSQVRIHQESDAVAMNKSLGAHAFTTGNDIYFNAGKYAPTNKDGQHLLAHELTHVVQQNGAAPTTSSALSAGSALSASPASSTGPTLQKAPDIQKDGGDDPKQKIKDETDKHNLNLDDNDLQFLQQTYPTGINITQDRLLVIMRNSGYNSVIKYPGFIVKPAAAPESKVDTFIFMVGKGRSILVSSQAGASILLDAGSGQAKTPGSQGAQKLAQALNNVIQSGLATAPAEIKISHVDIDHYNAVDDVLKIPSLSGAMVQVSKQQLDQATKKVGKDWNRMNVQFQPAQSLVQIDVVGDNLRETRAIIGDMEVIEYRSVAAHNALNTTTFNKNNTSAVTIVRDLHTNTTQVFTGDAQGRLLNEVVDIVGEDAFRRILGGGSGNLSLVEVSHHGGAVDKGPDARGMVRWFRLQFEASKGKVNFFTQTSPNFAGKTSSSLNFLRSSGIAVDRVTDDPSTTPGTSQVRKATGPAQQQITIDNGVIQQIRTLGTQGGEDIRKGYEAMANVDSLLEQSTILENAFEWMGDTKVPASLKASRGELEKSKTTVGTSLTAYWAAMETAAAKDGMRGDTNTTGIQTAVRAVKTTAEGISVQKQTDTINGLIKELNTQGRLFRNMIEISESVIKGDMKQLNTAKAEQTELLRYAKASVGEKSYDEAVWASWKEVKESWMANQEEYAKGLSRIEAFRAIRADQRMVLNISLARQMDLNELSARAAEGSVPGGGPAPVGSRVGAGFMLVFELARIALELAVQIKQSNEATARYEKAQKAQGYADLSWWQGRFVIPTIALVHKEGFWSPKYVEKMSGDDAYKVLREDKSVVAPEFDRIVIKDVKDEDLVGMIARFNSDFKTTQDWIEAMGNPDTSEQWFIRRAGSWGVKLWDAGNGEYGYVAREAIQQPMKDLFGHLDANQKDQLQEQADKYGTATIKDSALVFGTDKLAYVYNSSGNLLEVNMGAFTPAVSDLGERFAEGEKVHLVRAADSTTYTTLSGYYWKREGPRYAGGDCLSCISYIIEPNARGFAFVKPSHVIQQKAPAVQQKSETPEAGDPYEQQADAMADKVVQQVPMIQAKFKSSQEVMEDKKNIDQLRSELLAGLIRLDVANADIAKSWGDQIQAIIEGSDFPLDAGTALSLPGDVAAISKNINGKEITLPEAAFALRNLEEQFAIGDMDNKYKPYSISLVFHTLWTDIANYLLGGLQTPTPEIQKGAGVAQERLSNDLDVLIKMVRDPSELMNVELEAVVMGLVSFRQELSQKVGPQQDKVSERKEIGQRIGQLAREAQLLNDEIQRVQFAQAANPQQLSDAPLETIIRSQLDTIHQIRDTAATEKDTRAEYEDNLSLLGPKSVTVNQPLLPHPDRPETDFPEQAPDKYNYGLTADEAFPEITDKATDRFMSGLDETIKGEKGSVDSLKTKVIPVSPDYGLPEFTSMYRRWYAFISHENEKQDPAIKMVTDFMGIDTPGRGAYQLAGIPMGNAASNVEGTIVRSWLMMSSAGQLRDHVASPIAEYFSPELHKNKPTRLEEEATGTASDPHYQYGDFFKKPVDMTRMGEEAGNRQSLLQERQSTTSLQFNEVAHARPEERPDTAIRTGILKPSDDKVPIVAMKETSARDGWNFLVDVYNLKIPPDLVSREHKTMPPEVAEYLLARQQLHSTITSTHAPTYAGKPIGDSGMIMQHGVEGGMAISRATYLEGADSPPLSPAAASLRKTQDTAFMGEPKTDKYNPDYEVNIINDLLHEMSLYFEKFYATRQEAAYRVGSVLTVANIEYGLGKLADGLLDVGRIAEVLGMTVGISLGTAILDNFGPVGQLVSQGIHAYMGAQGITNMAAIAGLATFLTNAARTENITDARTWALMSIPALGDAQQLLDTIISTPAAIGSHSAVEEVTKRLREGPPSTVGQMADIVRPLMSDPSAGPAIREGIRSQLAAMGAKGDHTSENYRQIKALSQYLDEAYTTPKENEAVKPGQIGKPVANPRPGDTPTPGQVATKAPAPKEDVPLKKAEDKDLKNTDLLRDALSPMTPEKQAALQAMIPDELSQKVDRVYNPAYKGNTVRVYFREGKVVIEHGNVEPQNIQDHIGVARELTKYQGVLGAIRRLFLAIGSRFGTSKSFGTEGFVAELELMKLAGIIENRQERLNNDPKLADSPEEIKAIHAEIDDLQRQFLEHAEKINSLEEGKDYVAAEDNRATGESMRIAKGQKPAPEGYYWRKSRIGDLELVNLEGETMKKGKGKREYVWKYDKESNKVGKVNVEDIRRSEDEPFTSTTWNQAFRELGGTIDTASFGKFVNRLDTVFGIGTDEIIDQMSKTESGDSRGKSPEGKGMRQVRHTTKQFFITNKVLPYLTDKPGIKASKEYKNLLAVVKDADKAYRMVSQQRMLDITRDLDSSDKGNIAESWYAMVYGKTGDTQVEVTRKQVENLDQTRKLDRVEGDTIVELKNVSEAMGPREEGEFIDHVKMMGKQVQTGGEKIKKLRWVILDPKGAEPNRTFMKDMLKGTKNVTFVVLDPAGNPKEITSRDIKALEDPVKFKTFMNAE